MRRSFLVKDAAKAALAQHYRRVGHIYASAVNPLKSAPAFTSSSSSSPQLAAADAFFRERYCGDLSVEFDHILNEEQREWLIQATEAPEPVTVSKEDKQVAVSLMRQSEILDNFLHIKVNDCCCCFFFFFFFFFLKKT